MEKLGLMIQLHDDFRLFFVIVFVRVFRLNKYNYWLQKQKLQKIRTEKVNWRWKMFLRIGSCF